MVRRVTKALGWDIAAKILRTPLKERREIWNPSSDW